MEKVGATKQTENGLKDLFNFYLLIHTTDLNKSTYSTNKC